jgi:hypothetical protein
MKKRKIALTYKPIYNPEKEKQKTDTINKALIELRRNYLFHTNDNNRLKNKLSHFSKMFKSKIENEDKVNFISYQLFTDNIDKH